MVSPSACCAAPPVSNPGTALPSSAPHDDKRLHGGGCSIEWMAGGQADAHNLANHATQLVGGFDTLLGAGRTKKLMGGIDCRVHLHTVASGVARPGLATTLTAGESGRETADIFLLASGSHGASFRSAAGLPPAWPYLEKTFLHELAGVLFAAAANEKPTGFRFYDSPAWFHQGAEEYASIILMSDAASRRQVGAFYADRVRKKRDRIAFAPEVHVQDVYGDGALLVAYLVRERTVAQLLDASAGTLGDILKPDEWAGFDSWLASDAPFRVK